MSAADAHQDRTAALAASVAEALGAAEIDGMRRLSGGASRETWAFDADGRPLILQRRRPGGGVRGPGPAVEPALLRAAAAAGVPVPTVVADGEGGPLGEAWLIVERIDGETIPRRILRDEPFAHARSVLTTHCALALAAIHAIDPADVPGLDAGDQVAQFRELLDALGEPHPSFELGFRWLEAHAPPVRHDHVVHGDFRNGNLIVGSEGLRAVLDWELAHLGDPLEDLGWLCVRSWRFGAPGRVGGFGEVDELVAVYEEATGRPVDRDALHWWEVLGTLKWGVMCMLQASTHLSGVARSVELAAIGRRVCEVEHDLLLLLPGGRSAIGSAVAAVPADGGGWDDAARSRDATGSGEAAGSREAPESGEAPGPGDAAGSGEAAGSREAAVSGEETVSREAAGAREAGASRQAPGPGEAPESGAAPEPPGVSVPHDAPSARQLVEAVREFLEGDVMGATEGRVRFHARVATNVLAMVERELAHGPALAAAHVARLQTIGAGSEAELAEAIRSGTLDDRWDEIIAAVAATVAAKLAVANPRYAVPG
ncbi:MAG TPA: phosphotransferase [Acidimicrobiales bacterium]